MEKKTTIENFIKEYKSFNKDRIQESAIKKHVWKNKYVPYEEKCNACSRIVKASMMIDIDGKKILHQDTTSQYMLYILTLIDLYTDIKIDFSQGLYEFNLIEKEGVTNLLIGEMPSEERVRMDTILKMKINDYIENERSFFGCFSKIVDKYRFVIDEFTKGFTEALNDYNVNDLKLALERKIKKKK